jgi:hypothetical protein
MTEADLAKALLDPARVFPDPGAVLEEPGLSDAQRIEILRRWEYDARELEVADEEGFPPRPPGRLLEAVLSALHSLGAGPELDHTPPTKQGGV